MDRGVEMPPAEASADRGARRQFLQPQDASSPTHDLSPQNSHEVLSFDPTAHEPQTEEQEEETRNVELNLRRWAEQEKLQRKNSRSQPSRNHSALPTHTGLARRFSSLSRNRNTHSYENAIEMVHPGHFARRPEPAHAKRYMSVDSEEGQFVNVGEPSEQQALQADHSHSFVEPELPSGDIGSVSFDDFDENKPPHPPAQGADLPAPAPALDTPYAMAPTAAADSNMATAMARIRSQNFPTVTVGRASSVQHRRGSQRRAGPPLAVDTGAARSSSTRRGGISAIPEATHQDEADVASGTTGPASDPFASPLHEASETSSAAALSELPDTHARTHDYAGPNAAMQFSRAPEEPEITAPEKRWYWSDLLLGCGLCSTADQDEEQAAYTNPME